jgi:hypothetical protein
MDVIGQRAEPPPSNPDPQTAGVATRPHRIPPKVKRHSQPHHVLLSLQQCPKLAYQGEPVQPELAVLPLDIGNTIAFNLRLWPPANTTATTRPHSPLDSSGASACIKRKR